MSQFMLALFVAVLVFLGIYLSFDYWHERIWTRMLGVTEQTFKIYTDLFYQKPRETVLREQSYIAGGASFLFFLLLWPNVVIAVPFCMVVFYFAWRLPLLYLRVLVRPGRVTKFSFQMVDALTLMGNGLKSGLNIPQTLQIVVDEMPNPIKQEFGFVLSENRLGKPLEEAFENLGKRINSEDVSMFVTSVNILSETGGNIAETFQNITETIRERLKLQSKITAMTAQGMTSAFIVGALPWALGVILYVTDPDQMRPLFTTPLGWLILLVILGLEGMGFFVILKIVKIKV